LRVAATKRIAAAAVIKIFWCHPQHPFIIFWVLN
jgi:hypothetical protein